MLDRVAQQADASVARAIDWCALNSGSRNLAGLAEMAAPLLSTMARLGDVERIPLVETQEVAADGAVRTVANADALRLIVRPQAPVQIDALRMRSGLSP